MVNFPLVYADFSFFSKLYVEATEQMKAAEIIYLDNYFKKHPLEEGGTVADSEINLPLAKT